MLDKKYWIAHVSQKSMQNLQLKVTSYKNVSWQKQPLKRMQKDDEIVICSSKDKMNDVKSALQAFTAIGRVTDNEIYQYAE
jgi:hypothetical protein